MPTRRKTSSALIKAMTPSPALAEIVGPASRPRSEITAELWEYINRHRLRDSVNNRMINADEKLRVVFGGRDRVSMFEMVKLVSEHIGQEKVGPKSLGGGAGISRAGEASHKAAVSTGQPLPASNGVPRMHSAAALDAPFAPSAALAAVVGQKPRPRGLITRDLWAYIKKNGLQDRKNKRMINADDRLLPVFGGKAQVSLFELTKLVSAQIRHIPSSASADQSERSPDQHAQEPPAVPLVLRLDKRRVDEIVSDTRTVDLLLSAIFEASDDDEQDRTAESSASGALGDGCAQQGLLGLDQSHSALAKVLMARDEWARAEVEAAAEALGLLTDGAVERINEAVLDSLDLPLMEGDDPVVIVAEARAALLTGELRDAESSG